MFSHIWNSKVTDDSINIRNMNLFQQGSKFRAESSRSGPQVTFSGVDSDDGVPDKGLGDDAVGTSAGEREKTQDTPSKTVALRETADDTASDTHASNGGAKESATKTSPHSQATTPQKGQPGSFNRRTSIRSRKFVGDSVSKVVTFGEYILPRTHVYRASPAYANPLKQRDLRSQISTLINDHSSGILDWA